MSGTAARLQARLDAWLDAGVIFFASWTLCAHAAVAGGAGLDALLRIAPLALLTTFGWLAWSRRQERSDPVAADASGDAIATGRGPAAWQRMVVAAGATASAIAWAAGLGPQTVWGVAAATVALACICELRSGDAGVAPGPSRPAPSAGLAVLVGLSGACAAVALVAHRADIDDSFYLNLAVAAVEDPQAVLFGADTLHRVAGAPLSLPVYRVHSLELLHAALARLTGRPALDFAHLWQPALVALALPFVYARQARALTPRAWPLATAAIVAVLLFGASGSHGWAGFGLLRLHQGKGVLLTLALPAILAYGLAFARRGDLRSWTLLLAAQVAAVGVSASALWLAPGVAAVAVLSGVSATTAPQAARRLAAAAATCAYPLALALLLRADTVAAFRDAPIPSPEMAMSSLQLAGQAARAVLGGGPAGALLLFVATGAWAFAREPRARRVCGFGAAATLVLWNPFFADAVAAHLTSPATYWRVFWLLPLPALAAIVLAAPVEWQTGARSHAVTVAMAALLLGGLVLSEPRAFALSADNTVRLGAPGWKVPPRAFAAARTIVDAAAPSETVLAPESVAPWIPTLPGHPAALVVRREYLPTLHPVLGEAELRRRMRLMRLVSGRGTAKDRPLLERAAADELHVVCLSQANPDWPALASILRSAGFQKILQDADYQVWRRIPDADASGIASGEEP